MTIQRGIFAQNEDDRKLSLCEKKNVGMIQQCLNKNLTTDDTNKLQKNVGMTQQCQNKNLTKDDTNKVQKNVGMTQQC